MSSKAESSMLFIEFPYYRSDFGTLQERLWYYRIIDAFQVISILGT